MVGFCVGGCRVWFLRLVGVVDVGDRWMGMGVVVVGVRWVCVIVVVREKSRCGDISKLNNPFPPKSTHKAVQDHTFAQAPTGSATTSNDHLRRFEEGGRVPLRRFQFHFLDDHVMQRWRETAAAVGVNIEFEY